MPYILIADDHDLVRDTICAYLANVEKFELKSASDLESAYSILRGRDTIDLCVLDLNMPGMDGGAGLLNSIQDFPFTKFALMSGEASSEAANEAMKNGARGFLPKSLSAEKMVNAIQLILAGDIYFPYEIAMQATKKKGKEEYRGLSKKEIEVLRGLCAGLSNKEIARDLDRQEVTVKLHVKNILKKLGVKNRTSAALTAKSEGFS